ncbi:MAG: ASKHA domain-containing protein [Halothermotrichaceae bacterium]
MYKIKVFVNGEENKIKAPSSSNLLDILQNNGINISAPCAGQGKCGKCKVKIVNSFSSDQLKKKELELLSQEEVDKGVRLACRTIVDRDMTIYVDESSINEDNTMEIKKDSVSIDTGLKTDFNKEKLVSTDTYGLAVDIGTTTIVIYLIDLLDGEEIDVTAFANPQRRYGADVVSRVNFTLDNEDGIKKMQQILMNSLNQSIKKLAEKNELKKEKISQAVVVGNTIMLHTLLGLSAANIVNAPYIPVFTESRTYSASEFGLKISKDGSVKIPPSISGYIGADITAGMLVTEAQNADKYLFLDLGTNGEIVLVDNNKIITTSAAAGPAFEGANITFGMAAVNGAISRFSLNEKGIPVYSTIGKKTARGICGSGLIDIIAELLRNNYMEKSGKLVNNNSLLQNRKYMGEYQGINAFEIFKSKKEKIVLTQKDIREFQLAKAAVTAGIKIIFKEAGSKFKQVDKVYLAGGFSNYININNLIAIGILPFELKEKIVRLGNTAGLGAKLYLINKKFRKKAEKIKAQAQYIMLSSRSDFQKVYLDSMNLEIF